MIKVDQFVMILAEISVILPKSQISISYLQNDERIFAL